MVDSLIGIAVRGIQSEALIGYRTWGATRYTNWPTYDITYGIRRVQVQVLYFIAQPVVVRRNSHRPHILPDGKFLRNLEDSIPRHSSHDDIFCRQLLLFHLVFKK
jgi:hypothetical protein